VRGKERRIGTGWELRCAQIVPESLPEAAGVGGIASRFAGSLVAFGRRKKREEREEVEGL
jgi:hypothetical protein